MIKSWKGYTTARRRWLDVLEGYLDTRGMPISEAITIDHETRIGGSVIYTDFKMIFPIKADDYFLDSIVFRVLFHRDNSNILYLTHYFL